MSQNEETERLQVVVAACDVARNRRPVIGEIPEKENRRYLYAVPEGASGSGRFGVAGLEAAVERAGVAVLVDWDKGSGEYGLRYVPRTWGLPPALAPYGGPEARGEWEAWQNETAAMSRSVIEAAQVMASGREPQEAAAGAADPHRGVAPRRGQRPEELF